MKKLILSVLANMPFNQVCFAMRENNCKTLDSLTEKLADRYTKEDYAMIPYHIANAYHDMLINNKH